MTPDQLNAIIGRHQASTAIASPSEEQWRQSQDDILALLKDNALISIELQERVEYERLKGKYEVRA